MAFILTVALLFSYSYFSKVYAASDLTNPWSNDISFPLRIASQTSYAMNDKLFLMGGADTNAYSSVYSSIAEQGDLSMWHEQDTTLPESRYWAASTSKDRVYVLGGASTSPSFHYMQTVISGIAGAGGEVASWRDESSLPEPFGLGASTIVGDRIYFSGGFNSNYVSDAVYSAVINSDGSLGAWETVSTLPFRVYGHGMVSYGDYIYVIGGIENSTVLTGKVEADGTIASWEMKATFPSSVYRAGVTLVDNYIYVVGGNDGVNELDTVYFTTINPDGSLEPWGSSVNVLPNLIQGGTLTRVNDYLYFIGGYHNGYLDSVYKTKLNVTSTPSPTVTPNLTPSVSPSPSLSPTPSPTPIPTEPLLHVPLFMQTDNLWKNQIYDSATLWAPNTPGIYSWGCAMTSAVMVFRYQGITKLPDGKDLNPGTLNTWLKEQVDGYVNTGWVNWLALSRLSKLAKSQNPAFTYDALEYSRVGGYSPDLLREDIKQGIPGIIEVPGHFIVGKGIVGKSFKINDPFYDNRLNLGSYGNTFLSLGRFIPSHTDLSYMMLLVEEGVTVSVKDKNNNVVGEGFTQQPIHEDGGDTVNGKQFYMYYVKKPIDGAYRIEVSSESQNKYSLQAYVYDEKGAVKKLTQNGVLGVQKNDVFELVYDRKDLKKTSIKEKTNYDSLLADVEYFYSNKQIKNKTIYLLMKETVMQAKSSKIKKLAKGYMTAFIIILDTNKKKIIDLDAYDILKPQAFSIISSL